MGVTLRPRGWYSWAAPGGTAVTGVAARRAGHGGQHPRGEAQPPDPLVVRVGDVQAGVAVQRDAPGLVELHLNALSGRPVVASDAGAGHGGDAVRQRVDAADGVVLRVRDVHGPARVDLQPLGRAELGRGGGSVDVPRRAGAGVGGDDLGRHVDPSHLVVQARRVQVAALEEHRLRVLEPGRDGRSAVAGASGRPPTGDGVDDPVRGHLPDAVVLGVGDEQVPGTVREHVMRPGEVRLHGRPAVADVGIGGRRVAAVAGERADRAVGADHADAVVERVRDVDLASWTDGGVARLVECGRCRGTSVAREATDVRPGQRGDRGAGVDDRRRRGDGPQQGNGHHGPNGPAGSGAPAAGALGSPHDAAPP